MKYIIKQIFYFLLLSSLIELYVSCRKDKADTIPLLTSTNHSTTQSPLPDSNATRPGEYIFNNLSWHKDSLYSLSGFSHLFENLIAGEHYDSVYYKQHVKVYIRFTTWTSIPYVAQDHKGFTHKDIYFTDDNYIVTLSTPWGPVTIYAPRIIIFAKPHAAIDFSQRVTVKVIITS